MRIYTKNGLSITYEVIRKPNKNAYFRIKNGVLFVSAHPRTSLKTIEAFIDLKFEVFHTKMNESLIKESDDVITLWGNEYAVIWTVGSFKYEMIDQVVHIRTRQIDKQQDKKRVYAKELERMVNALNPKIDWVIQKVGIRPLPIKIKYLKSKFGSYHRKNQEITLNSFLAKLDPIYLEYVLYHEYAHALVFNHSKDFYNLLDKLMPNHKVYQKDLKKIAIT